MLRAQRLPRSSLPSRDDQKLKLESRGRADDAGKPHRVPSFTQALHPDARRQRCVQRPLPIASRSAGGPVPV